MWRANSTSLRNVTKFFSIALLAMNSSAYAELSAGTVQPDVDAMARELSNSDVKVVDEAKVQLSWAAPAEARVFDPLAEQIASYKLTPKVAANYTEALGLSGNPKYAATLEQIAGDKKQPGAVRTAAKKAKAQLAKQQTIAQEIGKGTEQATSNAQLWAIRYKNGLAVTDSARVRLAARDLYLHRRGKESLAVAADVLTQNAGMEIKDRYQVDAMAFLAKALGLSGDRQYEDFLKNLANTAKTKKLAEYAERSAQYYDPTFKSSSKLMNKKPAKRT